MSFILETLANKNDLTDEMAETAFNRLMDGELSPAQAGAFLLGLRSKGENPLEMSHAVRAVLARAIPLPRVNGNIMDIIAGTFFVCGLGDEDFTSLQPEYKDKFEQAGMVTTGVNPETGLTEIIEIPKLKWFVGVQFHPEYKSTVTKPHPLFIAFIKACLS